MMIMGGGLISWFQGWLAGPEIIGIKASYWVGVFCFLYLAFYGWRVSRILREQGISLGQNYREVIRNNKDDLTC